tara:strand:+ start:211 stop:915 length:705 start_codon:yes stop_codon:yes gene_type:complete
MTSLINADTSGGLKLTSDTSGALDIQSAGTTKIAMDSSGNVDIVGTVTGAAVAINGSTSGAITLAVPAVAGTRTLTLPAETGTVLTSATAGVVLQVVGGQETSGGIATTSTSYITFSTAPSFAITPAATSSKILVHMRIGMQYDGGGQIENTIYRAIAGGATTELSGGTTYGISFHGTSAASGIWKETVMTFLDAPNTTAAVTYTWYSRSEGGQSVTVTHAGAVNSTTLMEIAQ